MLIIYIPSKPTHYKLFEVFINDKYIKTDAKASIPRYKANFLRAHGRTLLFLYNFDNKGGAHVLC